MPVLEATGSLAESIWSDLTPTWPWEQPPHRMDAAWRESAAGRFAEMVAGDGACVATLARELEQSEAVR